jgi:two-component system NtrC family sensor kinase
LADIAGEVGAALGGRSLAKYEKARQRIVDLQDGLNRVRDLVTKLRTFSRLDEGEYKHVDMREGILSTLALLNHRLRKGIEVDCAFGTDNSLFCAPGPLNQVIMNLVGNAIDAIEGEGEGEGKIVVATEREDQQFVIKVTDSGPGVPQELRQRVFEPFFTTKEVGSGTGLGLALSYGIVERHHGHIEIGDRPGGGAVFTVRIPTDLEEREDAAQPAR